MLANLTDLQQPYLGNGTKTVSVAIPGKTCTHHLIRNDKNCFQKGQISNKMTAWPEEFFKVSVYNNGNIVLFFLDFWGLNEL